MSLFWSWFFAVIIIAPFYIAWNIAEDKYYKDIYSDKRKS